MITFLTSSFLIHESINETITHKLDEANGFVEQLRKYWKENTRFLIFASDPSDERLAECLMVETQQAFALAGFSISAMRCFNYKSIEEYRLKNGCSSENAAKEALKEAIEWADVFYLSGGHVPTENAFMKECDLKGLINDRELFDGIFLGLSAGSMNTADEVYLTPERPGEGSDPDFVRFSDGLGLTTINMVPHYQWLKSVVLDGKKLIDEIVAEDSRDREIYLIPDGSYFMIRNGITEFFGEGLIMENGDTRPLYSGIINSDNRRFKEECIPVFDTKVSEYYDWVLEYDTDNGQIEFFHISDEFLERGIIPINIDSFDELIQLFVNGMVVFEERETCIEQMVLPCILDEIERMGGYVRTVHIDTEGGINAKSLRVTQIKGNSKRLLVCLTDISMILDRDWMTDEYSRSGFITRVEQLLREPKYQNGYSVIYTNIKGFKAINDIFGTTSGDILIFQKREHIWEELNPVAIARLESDHFAVITKTEHITEEAMNRFCHQCFVEGTKRMPYLIRCGIYNITDHTKKVSYMIDQAKLAEKSIPADQGIPYAVCSEQMSQDYVNQRILVSELDTALEKGEFVPFYQPVVDAKTYEIVGAEALIRWKHSERGLIPPGLFIPVFEKEGLTSKLASFMVTSILDFNIQRKKTGQKYVPCSVNLSRADFYDTRLMELFKQKVKEQENIPDMIKIEITESSYAILESDALNFLEEMKEQNVSILLDDFGSGMSSLSTLELHEFDTVKLDMGFIRKIGKNPKAEAIIRHTIGMAHAMGAKVVAEGVEDQEQLAFLQSVDCDMIQGYYFYKPMPEEKFAKLL